MRTREVDDFGRIVFRPPALQVRVRAARFPRRRKAFAADSEVRPRGLRVGSPAPPPWRARLRPGRAAILSTCVTAFLWFVSSGVAAVTVVGPINLVVGDLDREVAFYTTVLPFQRIGEETQAVGPAVEKLYAVPGAHTRTMTLGLGDETITLTQFVDAPGRAIPADSRSFDHWFQHIAIVVRDMDAAYAQLAKHQVRHVSTAPQTLPAWNPNAGGIKAFYFQDPERHVLEIIWFPAGKGDPRWQRPTNGLFLGIDHTAIVVSDTDRSLAFYHDALGLRVAGGAENWGTEQEHLNQVFGARLRITALRAPHGPGIEFLEYITPPGGRPLPADAKANDLLAWSVTLASDAVAMDGNAVIETGGHALSPPDQPRQLVRDPDGHLLLLQPSATPDS